MTHRDQKPLWKKALRPLSAVCKRYLPSLSEAAIGIKNEMKRDPQLKAEVKRNFCFSAFFDLLETALWIVPALAIRKMPMVKKLARDMSSGAHDKISSTKKTPKDMFLATGVFGLRIASGAVGLSGAVFDAKLFNSLFRANRNRIKREIGSEVTEQQTAGLLTAGLETFSDFTSGLKCDPTLRRKFLTITALEILSDIVDARMGISRNMPGFCASVLFSEVLGLKEMDLTLKAIKLGIVSKQEKQQTYADELNSPVLRLMKLCGLEEQAEGIAREICARPKLKDEVLNSNRGIRAGAGVSIGQTFSFLMRCATDTLQKPGITDYWISGMGAAITLIGVSITGVTMLIARNQAKKTTSPFQPR